MLVKEGTWTVSYVLEVHVGGMGSVGRMVGSSRFQRNELVNVCHPFEPWLHEVSWIVSCTSEGCQGSRRKINAFVPSPDWAGHLLYMPINRKSIILVRYEASRGIPGV